MKTSIDFETASELDVTRVGSYVYAAHPSTRIRCMRWKTATEKGLWLPGMPLHPTVIEAFKSGEVHAWNAAFERLVGEACMPKGLAWPTFSQWRCTAAQARMNALPGALAAAARVLDIPQQKGDTAIMKKLSDSSYTPTTDELNKLYDYCELDVEAEWAIGEMLPSMPRDELFMYQLSEHINDRGILVDREFLEAMTPYLEEATEDLNFELEQITGGAVTKFTQVERIKKYLDWTGSMDAKAISKALEEGVWGFTSDRRVLEIRQDGAKSSTAKYKTIIDRLGSDDRLRGMFVYAGAGQTGRFSSTGAQAHNLPRVVPDNAELRIHAAKTLPSSAYKRVFPEPIIHQASQLIRPALIAAPGKTFVIGDYSAVEAKGVPYLAGNQVEIDAWASGKDRYIEDAANAFHVPESQAGPLRQAGKVVRLASQFCGKGGALMAMARGYDLELTKTEATEMAEAWHAANPWVIKFGKMLEKAALTAVRMPLKLQPAGEHLVFASEMSCGVQILRCQLASGRVISYHDVKIEEGPFGNPQLSAIKPSTTYRDWIWYGLIAENVTQAFCNDLLRHGMTLLEASGYNIVAHVHDEAVEEVDANPEKLPGIVAHITELLETLPDWAPGFPLTAKVHTSPRYTK